MEARTLAKLLEKTWRRGEEEVPKRLKNSFYIAQESPFTSCLKLGFKPPGWRFERPDNCTPRKGRARDKLLFLYKGRTFKRPKGGLNAQ
ncbi:aldo/keto reductase [Sesbania bispinosa]|nr:aldo/keto reductase [Sesbania bispinosa]